MNNSTYIPKHEIYPMSLIDGINVKFCPNTDNRVAAGRDGSIYVVKNDKLIKKFGKPNIHNYVLLGSIWYNGKMCSKYAHTLVIETFCGFPENKSMLVNHKNCDKADNRIENLEYVTPKENCKRYSDHCKENNIQRVRGKACKNYEIIECDDNWKEVRRFKSIRDAALTIAKEEGAPEKQNSIATQISYVVSGKYGCKTVRGKNFKLADESLINYIKQKTDKLLTPEESEILERMKKAIKQVNKEREIENNETLRTGEPRTMIVHKFNPKKNEMTEIEVESDYTQRIDLGEL